MSVMRYYSWLKQDSPPGRLFLLTGEDISKGMLMNYDRADKIHIRDLLIRTVIGIYPHERGIRQDLMINLTLYTNQRPAADADDFNLTVDYQAVQESVVELAESSSFGLIEALASAIAVLLSLIHI